MPVRKIAKIVTEAMRDADRARKTSADPKWRREQMSDRGGTLRRFETVESTIKEREAHAKSKAKTRKK
jgi:hypothetical protein